MAKMPSSAIEKTEEDSLTGKLADVMANISVTTEPVVVCGCQRKANIGDFETIDVYSAVVLPVNTVVDDALRAAILQATETGFDITTRETLKRYRIIKEVTSKRD